jgi:hypothetical protein
MTKAYLIDSKARQITEVEINGLDDMQRAVGGELGKVCVEMVVFNGLPQDLVLVDGDAHARDNPLDYGFVAGNSPLAGNDVIVGNGLVFGRDDEGGEFQAPVISLEGLRRIISWVQIV